MVIYFGIGPFRNTYVSNVVSCVMYYLGHLPNLYGNRLKFSQNLYMCRCLQIFYKKLHGQKEA